MVHKRKPDYTPLRVLGCRAWAHIQRKERKQLAVVEHAEPDPLTSAYSSAPSASACAGPAAHTAPGSRTWTTVRAEPGDAHRALASAAQAPIAGAS
jgi:hypothetical protein